MARAKRAPGGAHALPAQRPQRYTRWRRPEARAKAEGRPRRGRSFPAGTEERRRCGSTSWHAIGDTWDNPPIAVAGVGQCSFADFAGTPGAVAQLPGADVEQRHRRDLDDVVHVIVVEIPVQSEPGRLH